MIRHFIMLHALLLCIACKQHKKYVDKRDTPKRGAIYISVDESFKPVIEEQIKVYQSSNPDAHIIATYKPEAACLKDLMYDSVRMIITTRGLTLDEEKFYNQKLEYSPIYGLLALDAVVAIVHKNARDTYFSTAQLQKLVQGNDTSKQIILDGLSATSTVRYVLDSLAKEHKLGSNVGAAKNSTDLIHYISTHENAIGLLGLSWVGDMDTFSEKILSNIKIAKILCQRCNTPTYINPTPSNIKQHTYPMVRGLFYILKENATGLGTGFVNFMSLERGQLIFRRAYLVPAKISFDVRKMMINK